MAAGRYLAPRPDDEDFPPMGIVRRVVREFGLALVVAGLIVLLFVAYQLLGTNLTERHNQTRLRNEFDRALSAHAATLPTTTTSTTIAATTTTSPAGATTIPSTPTTTTAPPTTSTAPTPTAGQNAANPTGTENPSSTDNPTVGGGAGGGQVPTGAAIDHLVIPAIGVDKYVVQGVSQSDLTDGPGHYPQTVLPGQVGNAAIAGHRTTYGAPFFRLNSLKSGDRIIITDTTDHRFTYRVKSMKVVAPTDISVLDPTRTAQLTLTTCNPRFSASQRLVVVATLTAAKSHQSTTSTATPTTTTPTTTPAAVATPQATGPLPAASLSTGDTSARTPALAYGALVVGLWVLTRVAVHRTRRWKRGLAYTIGIVACLVALWFCFENVVRLLSPNL